jgi:hypothetical protein
LISFEIGLMAVQEGLPKLLKFVGSCYLEIFAKRGNESDFSSRVDQTDALYRHGLSFGNHDSQIAVTLGTRAVEVLSHSVPSRSQAFVHRDPRNLQPEPFRQFFDADGEPLKLEARDFHN